MNWLIHPLQSLRTFGVKRYVLSIVNNAIENYNGKISEACWYVDRYITKVERLLAFLKSLRAKLADGTITEEEADALCDEAKTLAKEMVA